LHLDYCFQSDLTDELVKQHPQHFALVDYRALNLALVVDQLTGTKAVVMKRTLIISCWSFALPTSRRKVSAWVPVNSMLAGVFL
jgi:hypothetical protein